MRFITIAALAYVPGFLAVLLLHIVALQMVTLPLALLRSAAWPFWIAFGWPHGSALPMD
jgi:hypothetical protein